MTDEKFRIILPIIVNDLAKLIADSENTDPMYAIKRIYNSHLYEVLEKENTKAWYYSTPMLYDLLREEETKGEINFPVEA